MKIIFTCGGTGGHINPAIAVAKLCQERIPGCEILFIGAEDGMENKLVPREGYRLETLKISNFQRKLTPKGIWHNLTTAVHMAGSMRKAKRVIREFGADIIVGTGGYASYPALKMGAKLGVPTAVHEANAVPGLTTKMAAKHVDKIMVSFEDSRGYYPNPEQVSVVGMPVRGEFFYTKKEQAKKELGMEDRPLVVSAWGSLGAREMNKKIAQFMVREAKEDSFYHVHATGSFGWRWMPDHVKELGLELSEHPNIDMREYIYNMPQLMAAADLVICRAGAATISEVCASGTPCVVIPSPNVTNNHQEKNARVLERHGAAVVIREADCDPDTLYETVTQLLQNKEKLREMGHCAAKMSVVDSAEQIFEVIKELTA